MAKHAYARTILIVDRMKSNIMNRNAKQFMQGWQMS